MYTCLLNTSLPIYYSGNPGLSTSYQVPMSGESCLILILSLCGYVLARFWLAKFYFLSRDSLRVVSQQTDILSFTVIFMKEDKKWVITTLNGIN